MVYEHDASGTRVSGTEFASVQILHYVAKETFDTFKVYYLHHNL